MKQLAPSPGILISNSVLNFIKFYTSQHSGKRINILNNLILRSWPSQTPNWCMRPPCLWDKGPPNKNKKNRWSSLLALVESEYSQNNITKGHFNVTLSNKEKWGGSIVRDPFKERMEDLIAQWDLVDIKPSKGKYT
jgi:hypothetical protein